VPEFAKGQDTTVEASETPLAAEGWYGRHGEYACSDSSHEQGRVASDRFTLNEVIEMAKMADKYGCIMALKTASGFWLNPSDSMDVSRPTHLMTAPCLLDNARHMRKLRMHRNLSIQVLFKA
jgi:hypothetical protein